MSGGSRASKAMPGVYVKMPAGMTTADGERGQICHGRTVGEVVERLIELEPRARGLVFDAAAMLRVTVLLNGLDVRTLRGLETPVADGDRVSLLPRLHGVSGLTVIRSGPEG